MPSSTIFFPDCSQKTAFAGCLFKRTTTSFTSSTGRVGACTAPLQTARYGDSPPGVISTVSAESWSCAGCTRGLWKAPPAFKTFVGKAPPSRS